MDEINKMIEASETRLFKAIFPNTTNHYNTLFGGTALQMMDEVSFICATRFSRKKVVTISTDKIDFGRPIPEGSIIELIARVSKVGRTSCVVKVDMFKENMHDYERELAVSGVFTFVAVGDDMKAIPII